jgi:hypothetical protein
MAIKHEPLDHPDLGRVLWNTENGQWEFRFALGPAHHVPVSITPEDSRLPLAQQGLDDTVQSLVWLRDHEVSVRQRIAEHMFVRWRESWYDSEVHTATSIEAFRDALVLSGVVVLEDRLATLSYADGELFEGHSIVLTIDRFGAFVRKPQLWG